MKQLLSKIPQNTDNSVNLLMSKNCSADDIIMYINKCIDSSSNKNMHIDISFMNIMDACYVSTMCSTKHFIKFPDGKIKWTVSSEKTKELTKPLNIGNSEFIIADYNLK